MENQIIHDVLVLVPLILAIVATSGAVLWQLRHLSSTLKEHVQESKEPMRQVAILWEDYTRRQKGER